MRDYENEEDFSYESDEIPQDEEFIPRRKVVIGKQLLLIIQLILCGIALLFMVIIKLIGGDFCEGILSWYETNYYDSIYTSEDGKNSLSIFGVNNSESNKENSENEKSENKDDSKTEASKKDQSEKTDGKSEAA